MLLELDFLDMVATTMVTEGRLSSIDLCHYGVVVEANDEQELARRIQVIRTRFVRHENPSHRRW